MLALALLFAVGVVSATFGSIVGLGGGIIIVPALMYAGPRLLGETMSTATAVGTSLTVLVFTALSSTVVFVREKKVDFQSGWLYFASSGPAAVFGASLTGHIPARPFEIAFGVFMLLMAALMTLRDRLKPASIGWSVRRTYTDPQGRQFVYGYNVPSALAIGFAVGLVSGLFGIGGGSLFVPAMVLLFRYPPHVATATSMFVIFLSSIFGSVTHWLNGEADGFAVLALAPGALIGGWLGARIVRRISGQALLWLLRGTLVLFAIRMIVG
jgi:hypothetical protein